MSSTNRKDKTSLQVQANQNDRRILAATQPARILLIDPSILEDEWLCKSVVEALEKIFLLAANISGTSSIPLIGIYALTVYPELVLPLTHTKSNFARLHSSLIDLLAFSSDNGKLEQSRHTEHCMNEGITEACRQFKRYTANLPMQSRNFHQLEVIFMTTRQGNDVRRKFVSLPEQADLDIIKRIVCTSISNVFNETTMDSQDTALDLLSDDLTSLIDVITLEADPLSLQKFLYSWLSDVTSDTEQLQLILPPPSPVESQIIIKCDLLEKIINPQQLPVHDAFSLDIKSNICKHVFPPPSKSLGPNVSIFQLKIISSVPRHTMCESILFGQPMVLQPTGCWKMEWDCLEKNQQMFHALCLEMANKDHVLLCSLQHPSKNRPTHCDLKTNCFDSFKTPVSGGKPSGFFILMPSAKSILVRSVVCRELCLPSNHTIPVGSVSQEHQLCIQSSLSKVENLTHFNPLDFQSGLFDALRNTSLPKSYTMSKARTQHQRQVSKKPQNNRPAVVKPGCRLTASSWSGTITDVSGTQMYQTKTGSTGKRRKIFENEN